MTEKIPTGGRTVIQADGTSEYIRYYDKPLTKEEQAATEWFHVLSPNEQYREVRRMKWNLDQARSDRDALKAVVQRQDAELAAALAKLATFTPEGYTMPPAAAELLDLAAKYGWKTGRAWYVDDDGQAAVLRIQLGHGQYLFKLSWTCDPGGGGRMVRAGLARAPRRDWHDAPSLKKIRETVISVGTEGT